MKLLLLAAALTISTSLLSQTHLTLNGEKCWILRTSVNHLDDTIYTVIVESGDIENEKVRVEALLKWKSRDAAEDRLRADGFRVEVYRREDITTIKRRK